MSESTETEYVLKQGGTIIRRDSTERTLMVSEAIITQLTNSTVTHTHNVFNAITNDGQRSNVSLITKGRELYCHFPIKVITIRAPFRLVDGRMVPFFSSAADPTIQMQWTAPESMRLRVLIQIAYEGALPRRSNVHLVWLYAYDGNSNAYRLPLPNLYDDCKVCTGTNARVFSNTIEATVELAMENLRNSAWNADLWTTVEQSQTLFQFVPNGDVFDTFPCNNWVNQCRKVATAFTAMIPL